MAKCTIYSWFQRFCNAESKFIRVASEHRDSQGRRCTCVRWINHPNYLGNGEYFRLDLSSSPKYSSEHDPQRLTFALKPSKALQHITVAPEFDVGVAKIACEERTSSYPIAQAIKLPNVVDNIQNRANESVHVAGWGYTNAITRDMPARAQYTRLHIVAHEECKQRYKRINVTLNDSALCAAGEGTDSCEGDSGGPLIIRNGFEAVLYGVVSFGPSLCAGLPGVYVHIPSVVDWIKFTVEGAEQAPSACSIHFSNTTHIYKYSLRNQGVGSTMARNVLFRNASDGKVNIFKISPLQLMTVDSRTRDAESAERRVHWLLLHLIEDPNRTKFQIRTTEDGSCHIITHSNARLDACEDGEYWRLCQHETSDTETQKWHFELTQQPQ